MKAIKTTGMFAFFIVGWVAGAAFACLRAGFNAGIRAVANIKE